MKKLDLSQSQSWKARALPRVPVMSQTFSKAPMCYPQGSHPAFLRSGKGARVTDVDGNEYIDYILGLGPVILGYADPVVDAAIREQLESGITFSMAHPLEVEVAELLAEVIPCAEMARYSKTGSDVTSAAVRLARAYTGRERVANGSYHGWHDWYASSMPEPRSDGIPKRLRELLTPFDFNDIASLDAALRSHPGEYAAVILEAMTLDEPKPGYLDELIALSHKHGALVIFDEIVSGFRFALGGAQDRYKVKPDLACFGKAMANGMPLATVVGRADVMRKCEDVFFSTTFGGETLSLAAAKATITELRRRDVPAHLWKMGELLKAGFEKARTAAGVDGYAYGPGPHFSLVIKDAEGQVTPEVRSLFLQECIRRGVLMIFANLNLSAAHGPDEIAYTVRVFEEALGVVGEAIREGKVRERLDGEPYQEVFRRNR